METFTTTQILHGKLNYVHTWHTSVWLVSDNTNCSTHTCKKKLVPLTFKQPGLAQLLNTLHTMVGIKDPHPNPNTKNVTHTTKLCKLFCQNKCQKPRTKNWQLHVFMCVLKEMQASYLLIVSIMTSNDHAYSEYVHLIPFIEPDRQGQIHKSAIHVATHIHAKTTSIHSPSNNVGSHRCYIYCIQRLELKIPTQIQPRQLLHMQQKHTNCVAEIYKKAPRISVNCVLVWVHSNKCNHLISITMSSIMEIQHRYSIHTTLISLRTTEQQGPQCTNHRRHASRQAAKNRLWFCF